MTFCKLWAIDRDTFQTIMMQFGIEKHDEYMEILRNLPSFNDVDEDVLTKFVDVIDEVIIIEINIQFFFLFQK